MIFLSNTKRSHKSGENVCGEATEHRTFFSMQRSVAFGCIPDGRRYLYMIDALHAPFRYETYCVDVNSDICGCTQSVLVPYWLKPDTAVSYVPSAEPHIIPLCGCNLLRGAASKFNSKNKFSSFCPNVIIVSLFCCPKPLHHSPKQG